MNRIVAYRLLLLAACAFWLGGLTFYAAVVIPTANAVLGSHRIVGFVTQRVTGWINLSAVVVIALLFLNLARAATGGRNVRTVLWLTWAILLAAQLGLFALHPVLDSLLDVSARQIVDPPRFYRLHRIYLMVSTVQQAAGLAHIGFLLGLWQRHDRVHVLSQPLSGSGKDEIHHRPPVS